MTTASIDRTANTERALIAQTFLQACKDAPVKNAEVLDALTPPVLELLQRAGVITELCHVEFEGVFEHSVVPVFWFDDEAHFANFMRDPHCLNLNADGSITVFN